MPNASLHLLHTFLVTPATTPTPASRKAWCLRHNVNTLVTQSPADALPKGWGGVGWGYALAFTWGETPTTGAGRSSTTHESSPTPSPRQASPSTLGLEQGSLSAPTKSWSSSSFRIGALSKAPPPARPRPPPQRSALIPCAPTPKEGDAVFSSWLPLAPPSQMAWLGSLHSKWTWSICESAS